MILKIKLLNLNYLEYVNLNLKHYETFYPYYNRKKVFYQSKIHRLQYRIYTNQ